MPPRMASARLGRRAPGPRHQGMPHVTTTHTPGPWQAPTDRRERWIRGDRGLGVCLLPRPGDLSENLSRKIEHAFRIAADASLIAAAPALLAALRDLLPHLPDAWSEPGAGMCGRVQAARAAIAKAEGR